MPNCSEESLTCYEQRGEAETIGGAAFDAEVPSSSSPSSSNSPSSCRPLLGSSQSTPMIRTFSTEVEEGENEGVAEIPQRAEVEKHDFQSKLREVLTEISQTTLTAATVPAIPTSIAVPGDASSLPSSSSGVDQGFTVPLQRGNKQHQSQADLFIPDSIPTAQKMSIEHYFLENSIIEESHNESGGEVVYKCSMGPDDLPGLKAWTLVSTQLIATTSIYVPTCLMLLVAGICEGIDCGRCEMGGELAAVFRFVEYCVCDRGRNHSGRGT